MITGLHLITGKRGNGKTLLTVKYIDQEVQAGRVVAVCNVRGLKIPGVIELDHPSKWPDLPAGALLVVDEAQKYWRVRRSGDPPPELQDLETARHFGISHLFITQDASFLDSHIRKLVDVHEFILRRGNVKASEIFKWENRIGDTESPVDRAAADTRVWLWGKELKRLGALYESAEIHQTPLRIPRKLWIIGIGLTLACLGFWWAFHKVKHSATPDAPVAEAEVLPASGSAAAGTRSSAPRGVTYATAAEYAAAFNPTIPTAPWTAPAYSGRAVVAEPIAVCMIAGAGLDANGEHQGENCRCMTEQGTRYNLPDAQCRFVVTNGGVYNPFKRPPQPQRISDKEGGASAPVASPDATPTALHGGTAQPFGTLASYGTLDAK